MTNQKLAKIILFFTFLQLVGCIVLLRRVGKLETEFINEIFAIALLTVIIYYAVYLVVLILHIKRSISLRRIVTLALFCFLPVILSGLLVIFVNSLYQ